MRNITANAILNLKQDPQTLIVHGSLMTYRADETITIERQVPLGFNPSILLLRLEVHGSGSGPMKGISKPFHFEIEGEEAKQYSQVTLMFRDSALNINVEIFG